MSFDVREQRVVVVGGGRSGRAAAELLVSRGARVTLTDLEPVDRAAELTARGITLDVGPHRPELLAGAHLIVLSPGVSPDQPVIAAARRGGVPVIGELELASRWLSGRIVAITGTKGKSTTSTLTARILQEAGFDAPAGGNIGTALSTQVSRSSPASIHVVEVSSFQLEMTDTFHPWIAVLLNLSADHLDRHGTFEAYSAAKARVFANQTAEDWAVINADDPATLALARAGRARRLDFALDTALDDGVTTAAGAIVRRRGGQVTPLVPLTSVRLPGRHLLADVLAAVSVASVVGVPPDVMRAAIEDFSGLEHALERVATVGDVQFVNDSKATNIAAARRALESFDGGVVVILGGRFKGGRFEDLRDVVRAHAAGVVAIGEAAPLIHAALDDVVPVRDAGSMADAVQRAAALVRPGGVVLLAPACASFDMFKDYADRGRAFKAAVAKMQTEEVRQR
ncbi:MAG TPA: UDP-N-acetylmuramoyl-L-alanine--D-glutamate ligase [Vicinamibacterales bacterium]|nr:UDP-N-acetylmuramoyl-L-alanine--D-glutamate ligase [Vicinamibacterales bacterium]